MDASLEGFYYQWILDDIQEITAGWYTEPLYPGCDSPKNYLDTGELTGLVTARDPEGVRMELGDISQVCDVDENTEEEYDGDRDADGAKQQEWGTVDGLTPSARYMPSISVYLQSLLISIVA